MGEIVPKKSEIIRGSEPISREGSVRDSLGPYSRSREEVPRDRVSALLRHVAYPKKLTIRCSWF